MTNAPPISADPWKDDLLGRSPVANQLARIVETLEAPAVVSVSAEYGMGKTFFAKRWVEMLKSRGKLAVYFNAWQTDFAEDPLLAFIDALKDAIGPDGLVHKPTKPLAERAKALGKVGAKIAAKGLIRAATFGAVGESIESELEAAVSGSLDEVERLALLKLETFGEEKKERARFKEELSRYRRAILDAAGKTPTKATEGRAQDEKLYIVIDELDRCRPAYALAFLEDVKHLFDAEGLIFVVFADEQALESTAEKLLGFKSSSEGYLKKFVNYTFRLPAPDRAKFAQLRMSLACRGVAWRRGDFWGNLCQQFGELTGRSSLTLRQIELVVRQFEVAVRSQPDRRLELAPALALGAVLREVNPGEFSKLANNRGSFDRIMAALQIGPADTFLGAWALLLSSSITSGGTPEIRERAAKISNNLDFEFSIDGDLGKLVHSYIEGSDLLGR